MIINPGRNSPDIKVQTSLAGTPYSSLLSITAKTTTNIQKWRLAATTDELKTLPHKQLTNLTKPYVSSTSILDNSIGIGLRLVQVVGLDVNYQFQEELVALNGQTPVQVSKEYIRIFELTGILYGSNIDIDTGDSISVGDIYIGTGDFTLGIPTNPIVAIKASDKDPNSRVGIFTTWEGSLFLIRSLTCTTTADITDDNSVYIMLALRFFGFGDDMWFKTMPFFISGNFKYTPDFYLPIPPKTDIQIRVHNGNSKQKTCSIELTLEERKLR